MSDAFKQLMREFWSMRQYQRLVKFFETFWHGIKK